MCRVGSAADAGIIQGQLDTALNELGLRQAELTGAALQNEPIARIVSSPLQRAHNVRPSAKPDRRDDCQAPPRAAYRK